MNDIMLERFVDDFRVKLRDLLADAADLPAAYQAVREQLRQAEREFDKLYDMIHTKRLVMKGE